jgi:hypothetical protein
MAAVTASKALIRGHRPPVWLRVVRLGRTAICRLAGPHPDSLRSPVFTQVGAPNVAQDAPLSIAYQRKSAGLEAQFAKSIIGYLPALRNIPV